MKKLLAMILCLIMVLSAASCGSDSSQTPDEKDTKSARVAAVNNGRSTLMIYMIGSDLESKSAAGTDDLQEIQDSGIDLQNNNVVILAGGCVEWQNEMVSAEQGSVLTLGEDGFSVEKTYESASMGEPETLARFLDYCVEEHPAEHYALILWNHGNGPLIGYGKDTLYENDSLTLSEMAQGLEKSAFAGKDKLDWIGFDACLMASAELSCVLSPYAEYLVASQEVEPAFGWNYDFLKDYGKVELQTMLTEITEGYLQTCLDYFEKKDYHDRDTTLSCVNLAYADELEEALNALFAAAEDDIEKEYDHLAARRVSTRALGRASTGSEYDLVDLKDLAQQMKEEYPAQAQALAETADKMVISNSTNGEQLCGMSLYYPFYNKNYYEDQWRDTYQGIGVFSDYLSYLQKYEDHWLGEDAVEKYATSETPKKSDSTYVLQLTEEQAKHYASAKYYIFQKVGEETFTKCYSSSDITYENGKLTANFDGNVIYGHNDLDTYFIPVTTEHDTVGEVTNYSINVQLSDKRAMETSGGQAKLQNGRFVIAADKAKSKISISALMPRTTQEQGSDLAGGKYEELDVSDYKIYYFWDEQYRTITRTDNNVIKPVDEWKIGGSNTTMELNIADGMEFVYAPLDNGTYSLVFEICDTQNNLYCSEPIDVKTNGKKKFQEKEPTIVESDGKYPLLLKEDDSFALYLDKNDESSFDSLTLYAENKTDKKLTYYGTRLSCNKTLCCNNGSAPTGYLDAKEKARSDDEFDFGDAADSGALKKISSLGFTMVVIADDDKQTLWKGEKFVVNFKEEQNIIDTDDWLYNPILDTGQDPLFGATVAEQTIEDTSDKKIELLALGKDYSNIKAVFRVTNKSRDNNLCIDIDGVAIDNIFFKSSVLMPFYGELNAATNLISPGMTAYRIIRFDTADTERYLTKEGAQKVDVVYRTADDTMSLWMGYGNIVWKSVKISKKAKDTLGLSTGKTTLMDENGVTIKLNEYDSEKKWWYLTLENHTNESVSIKIDDLTINGKSYTDDGYGLPVDLYQLHCGPGQKSISCMKGYSVGDNGVITFRFTVYNFTDEKIRFSSNKTVTLEAK